jgi:hypothetical protein
VLSYEADSTWDSQEILRMYWNLKFQYRIKKYRPPNVPVLIEVNPRNPCPFTWDLF